MKRPRVSLNAAVEDTRIRLFVWFCVLFEYTAVIRAKYKVPVRFTSRTFVGGF